jgi:hypothetical protein
LGSNRRFGLVLTTGCAAIYAVGLWYGTEHRSWLFAAAGLLMIAIAMPRILAPLKRLWMKLGPLLHVVVSPVLLGLFYFLGVTPIGLLMQALGMDPLRLRSGKETYWIERKPPGPEPSTMTELF